MIDDIRTSCTSKALTGYLLIFSLVCNLATTVWISFNQTNDSSSTFHVASRTRVVSSWDKAMQKADELMSDPNTRDLASCLAPNTERTIALVKAAEERNLAVSSAPLVSLPVLNTGMPKCGSSSLFDFFQCVGLHATHFEQNQNQFEGLCMRDAARTGLPFIETCASGKDALLHMDVEFPFGYQGGKQLQREIRTSIKLDECFFPQLSLLEEIHDESPDATFIMNFRPIKDWIRSVKDWGNMLSIILK